MSYTSEDGDTLPKIAEKFYGDRRCWQIIYEANPDAIVLKRGMVIFIPCDLDFESDKKCLGDRTCKNKTEIVSSLSR